MKNPSPNNRAAISILMLVGFLTIFITGLLSYGLRYNSLLSSIHTLFGLLFLGYGLFHLRNNVTVLKKYFKRPIAKRLTLLSIGTVFATLVGVIAELPPFQTVIDASYALKELRPIDRQRNETLSTRYDVAGRTIVVDVKAGDHYSGPGAVVFGVTTTAVPQMAIWIEDTNGTYIETLYVTKKASNSSYIQSIFGSQEVRRPEALPHWSHARGVQSADGLMMPSQKNPVVDAMTGATPLTSFELNSVTQAKQDNIVVKLEINRSFDFNDTYHANAFPNDAVYSGNGFSAQPSLIYAASIDLQLARPIAIMELIGHGHYSGQDGNIYTNLSGITSAKEMLRRAIVEVLN